VLNSEGADLSIINATITNNIVTQTEPGPIFSSAVASGNNIGFYALKLDHSNFAFLRAATSQNSIVAGNARNGNLGSCAVFDTAAFGLAGTVDLTPTDLGGNITDDINCTDYRLEPNILSTLGPLQDNGGIVPTIALLDGSPAIGAAVQVLGISVDARGVARPSSPDVGAYQTVFVSSDNSITSPTGVGGTLPETGKTSTTLVLQALLMLLLGLAAVSSSKKMHTIGESKSVKVLN